MLHNIAIVFLLSSAHEIVQIFRSNIKVVGGSQDVQPKASYKNSSKLVKMQGLHYLPLGFVQICEARKAEVVSSPCRIVTDEAPCAPGVRRLVGTLWNG